MAQPYDDFFIKDTIFDLKLRAPVVLSPTMLSYKNYLFSLELIGIIKKIITPKEDKGFISILDYKTISYFIIKYYDFNLNVPKPITLDKQFFLQFILTPGDLTIDYNAFGLELQGSVVLSKIIDLYQYQNTNDSINISAFFLVQYEKQLEFISQQEEYFDFSIVDLVNIKEYLPKTIPHVKSKIFDFTKSDILDTLSLENKYKFDFSIIKKIDGVDVWRKIAAVKDGEFEQIDLGVRDIYTYFTKETIYKLIIKGKMYNKMIYPQTKFPVSGPKQYKGVL